MTDHILKISFIGYGNMAKAIASSLSNHSEYQLSAASPSLTIGIDDTGIATHYSNLAILNDADIIILAVKPSQMNDVLLEIRSKIPKNTLIISVAAGLSLSWFAHYIPDHPIVRAMPNIATTVNMGATPLISNQWVNKKQQAQVTQLFEHSGIIAWVGCEHDMDRFTALSGSGPAYCFLFLEAMISAAERLGIPYSIAKTFALQTVIGSATLAKESQSQLDELRNKVTSKGGTTAAGIEIFSKHHMNEIVHEALEAAYRRAQELEK